MGLLYTAAYWTGRTVFEYISEMKEKQVFLKILSA